MGRREEECDDQRRKNREKMKNEGEEEIWMTVSGPGGRRGKHDGRENKSASCGRRAAAPVKTEKQEVSCEKLHFNKLLM